MFRFAIALAAASLSACATIKDYEPRTFALNGNYSALAICAYRTVQSETLDVTHSEVSAERMAQVKLSGGGVMTFDAKFYGDGVNRTRLIVSAIPSIRDWAGDVRAAALSCR